MISGWPSVPFASRPDSEIFAGIFAASCAYFIPIFASCSIYCVLICHKKRKFKNKIQGSEAQMNERNDEKASSNFEIDSNQNL